MQTPVSEWKKEVMIWFKPRDVNEFCCMNKVWPQKLVFIYLCQAIENVKEFNCKTSCRHSFDNFSFGYKFQVFNFWVNSGHYNFSINHLVYWDFYLSAYIDVCYFIIENFQHIAHFLYYLFVCVYWISWQKCLFCLYFSPEHLLLDLSVLLFLFFFLFVSIISFLRFI